MGVLGLFVISLQLAKHLEVLPLGPGGGKHDKTVFKEGSGLVLEKVFVLDQSINDRVDLVALKVKERIHL